LQLYGVLKGRNRTCGVSTLELNFSQHLVCLAVGWLNPDGQIKLCSGAAKILLLEILACLVETGAGRL